MRNKILREELTRYRCPTALCQNFMQDGRCYATGQRCLLGPAGASARNQDKQCELQGGLDVWVTQDDRVLVTDLGFPSSEPKQCLAFGINLTLATAIARRKSRELGTKVLTTRRRCFSCARLFWFSEHTESLRMHEFGRAYLCPKCIGKKTESAIAKKLGVFRYRCG